MQIPGPCDVTGLLTVRGQGTSQIFGSVRIYNNHYLEAGTYINWGAVPSAAGYGVRDNAGTIEFKHSGGTWAALTLPANHSLLSATHPDTVVATVQRGDLIVGVGASPFWSRLAKGSSGTYLRSDGTDLAYSVILAGDLPASIDAAKIGSGNVSNTEFGYLDGVTSALQGQIDGKAAVTHGSSHAYGGSDAVDTTPPGVIEAYGGTTAPTGYLMCDGTSYLRASYAALFAVIGIAFGSVDGSHFNVPDLRQRYPRGKGAADTLGATGGSDETGYESTSDTGHGHADGEYTDISGHLHKHYLVPPFQNVNWIIKT